MVKPITPKEVQDIRSTLPDAVFVVFNEAITRKWSGSSATVLQKDVDHRIASMMNITIGEAIERGYLDIETAYRAAGWIVDYDKPGWNESYDAFYVFTMKD